jgi:hypothetical protein
MNSEEARDLVEEIQKDCPGCGPLEYCWEGENCVIHIPSKTSVTPLLVTSREEYEKLRREGALE